MTMADMCASQVKLRSPGVRKNMDFRRHIRIILIMIEIHLLSYTICEASDDLLSKRPKRPTIISQKNLIEARDDNGVHSIVPHHIYSNENSNLNSVGLSESAGDVDGTGIHNDIGQILQGPNVCTQQEPYTVSVRVEEKQPYRQRTYTWCWSIPFRCSKYKIRIKTIYRTEMIPKWRPVQVCCKGFAKSTNGTDCIPICSQRCYHGRCVAPDQCECEPGFGGTSCSKSCPPGKWGEDCGNECPCLNGAQCDPLSGDCTCTPGWHGKQCNIKCPYGSYGQNCTEACNCQNEGSCDHISGACNCTPGWRGPICDEPCPPGTHGSKCESTCQCQNGGSCHPVSGKCYCPKGWTGQVCANPCPYGTYGLECKEKCDCYNGAFCDHINGRCKCLPGFQGIKCQEQCPYGKWGNACRNFCQCKNEGTCDPIDGSCSCKDGWTGAFCEKRMCEDDARYGPDCSLLCSCDPKNTEMCHPWTGACVCKPGYAGSHCHRPCPTYTWGKDCRNVCDCQNYAFCNGTDGTCTCSPGYLGQKCDKKCAEGFYGRSCQYKCRCKNGARCSPSSGHCICTDGWTGFYCDVPCPKGKYGKDCQEKCTCRNGAACDHRTGKCTCTAGYKGKNCELPCDRGRYGIGCAYRCKCEHANSDGCDHITGKCICNSGWRGVKCDSICDRGRYGPNCQKRCDCEANGSSCDQQFGKCICEQGYMGSRCDRPCQKGFYGFGCRQACPRYTGGYDSCHFVTGQWECEPGYTGFYCRDPCIEGQFGRRCMGKCTCKNNAQCHHVTGECRCPGGWMGPDCTQPCPPGTFGPNCTRQCYCHNNATCNPVDGKCKCLPGFTGARCEEFCQEGYWGQDCYKPCQCNSTNFVCDPAHGCICRPGYRGEECSHRRSGIDGIDFPTSTVATRTGMEITNTDLGTVVGVPVVLLLSCIILAIMFYCRCYIPAQRKKTLERAHVTYIADPTSRPDRHHFDNPVYSTNFTNNPGAAGGGGPINGAVLGQVVFPLNNVACVNRVVNRFATNASSSNPPSTCKNTLNSDRERLRGFGGVEVRIPTAPTADGGDGLPNSRTYHDSFAHSSSMRRGTFGRNANSGAFSYSTLSNRKNLEADARNPNLYTSLEDLKDNRVKVTAEENIYDEIRQRQRTLQREAAARASIGAGMDPVVKISLGNQDMCSSVTDDTALTTMSMLTPDDDCCEDPKKLQVDATNGLSYDKLDFNRPTRQLKPHYTSSTTLRSVKSTMEKSKRDLGDGSSDDTASPKDDNTEHQNNSFSNPANRQNISHLDDGYIDCADLVRRHVDNNNPPSSFIIATPQSSAVNTTVPSSQGIIVPARGSFTEEVLQSLNNSKFDDQNQNTSPSTDNGEASTDTEKPSLPERKRNRNSRGKFKNHEPDSGISSAISSTTRPWSQNDTTIDPDQDPLHGANISNISNESDRRCSTGLPTSLGIIGTHRELDKELNEIEDNISSFRNSHNLFNNKSHMSNPMNHNQGEFVDDDEEDDIANMTISSSAPLVDEQIT